MTTAALVPLPVLLPLLGSGAALMLFRFPRAQRVVSVAVLAAVAVVAAVLLVIVDREGAQVVWLGGWADLGIALVADRLAALMLLVSAVVTLAVLLVGYLSGAFVAKPLRRLREALDDAPAAGFGLRISHARRDEFGAAFDSFNRAAAAVEPQLAGGPVESEASVLATRIADMPRLAA